MVNQRILNSLENYTGELDSLNAFVDVVANEMGPDWTDKIYGEMAGLDGTLKEKLDHAFNYYAAMTAWNEIQSYLTQSEPLNDQETLERVPILEHWLAFFGAPGEEVVKQLQDRLKSQGLASDENTALLDEPFASPAQSSNASGHLTTDVPADLQTNGPIIPSKNGSAQMGDDENRGIRSENEIYQQTNPVSHEQRTPQKDNISLQSDQQTDDVLSSVPSQRLNRPDEAESTDIMDHAETNRTPLNQTDVSTGQSAVNATVSPVTPDLPSDPHAETPKASVGQKVDQTAMSENLGHNQPIGPSTVTADSERTLYDNGGSIPVASEKLSEADLHSRIQDIFSDNPVHKTSVDTGILPQTGETLNPGLGGGSQTGNTIHSAPSFSTTAESDVEPMPQKSDEHTPFTQGQAVKESLQNPTNEQNLQTQSPLKTVASAQEDVHSYQRPTSVEPKMTPVSQGQVSQPALSQASGERTSLSENLDSPHALSRQEEGAMSANVLNAPRMETSVQNDTLAPLSQTDSIAQPISAAHDPDVISEGEINSGKDDKYSQKAAIPLEPESEDSWRIGKIFRQLDFVESVQGFISARCLELGYTDFYTYRYYGFLVDVLDKTIEELKGILADTSLYELIDQKKENGVHYLQNQLIAYEKQSQEAHEGFLSDLSPLPREGLSVDDLKKNLGAVDTSGQKEYLGPAPDGFEMIEDPYENMDETALKKEYEKIEAEGNLSAGPRDVPSESSGREAPPKNQDAFVNNASQTSQNGVQRKMTFSLGVKPVKKPSAS